MSIPMVVYGQDEYVVEIGFGSGLNNLSKGWAEVSVRVRFNFSVSSLVDGRMYPAVASTGWSASTRESLMMLCACFFAFEFAVKCVVIPRGT